MGVRTGWTAVAVLAVALCATARMTGGTSFALTEYWRTIGSGKAVATAPAASASVARSMA